MSLTEKTNHVEEAKGNLVAQFKRKVTFEKFIEVYIRQIQELEAVDFQLLEERGVDTSIGWQLDVLGKIVGEPRQGRSDSQYRAATKARIKLNLSNATAEDIIGLIRALAGDVRVLIWEFFPASFIAQILDPINPSLVDPYRVVGLIESGRGAGIQSIFTFGVTGSLRYDVGPGYDLGKYGGAL